MFKNDNNIIGVGCDFQNEIDSNIKRKLAIENLSGGEKEKIKWMLKNMAFNKAFIFQTEKKSKIEKKKILNELKNRYISYR